MMKMRHCQQVWALLDAISKQPHRVLQPANAFAMVCMA
jgi:hypothetical protein